MKNILCIIVFILSIIAAAYVGFWIMMVDPILYLFDCLNAGTLTTMTIVITILKCAFASTVAGAILFVGMLVRDYIGDHYE